MSEFGSMSFTDSIDRAYAATREPAGFAEPELCAHPFCSEPAVTKCHNACGPRCEMHASDIEIEIGGKTCIVTVCLGCEDRWNMLDIGAAEIASQTAAQVCVRIAQKLQEAAA